MNWIARTGRKMENVALTSSDTCTLNKGGGLLIQKNQYIHTSPLKTKVKSLCLVGESPKYMVKDILNKLYS